MDFSFRFQHESRILVKDDSAVWRAIMIQHRREGEERPFAEAVDAERVGVQNRADAENILRRKNVRIKKFEKWLDNVDQISVHDLTASPVVEVVFEQLQSIPLSLIVAVVQFEQERSENKKMSVEFLQTT